MRFLPRHTGLLLGLLLTLNHLSAQNLTGDWNGYLTQNDRTWSFAMNMKIMHSGNQLHGFARYTTNAGTYVRLEFTGEVQQNTISIKETKVVEDGGRGTWNWCIKILNGRLTKNNNEYVIEGTWANDGNRGYQGGVHTTGAFNCPPGRFRISKVYSCSDEQAGLLVNAIEKWRIKGRFESVEEWQKRTSFLNTEKKYRELLRERMDQLLSDAELQLDYNPETERFTIHSSCFADFQLRVPRSEADCFRQQFQKSNFRQLVFDYQSENRSIVVDSVMLYNPCNQLSYTLHDPSDIAIVSPGDSLPPTGISALEKRSITIINELEVKSKTVELRFYDNGSIDGDIISIYFNGTLIQERQTLSASPIRLTLQLREGSDNVIAMYAENLGAIPPNTALMLVDDGTNTTEVLLSSDLNASGAVRIRVAKP